jgi:hypothetical protein
MTVNVINPDSAILQQLDGEWQKICALLLWKLAPNGVTLTHDDIQRFPQDLALYTHGHKDSIDFKMITLEAAKLLAEHDARTNRGRA